MIKMLVALFRKIGHILARVILRKEDKCDLMITITRVFWSSSILTAYELYSFIDKQGARTSFECLGNVWGKKIDGVFIAELATTTQLIESRDASNVTGPDPWTHVLHNVWAVLDVDNLNYLGSFHSHPWSEKEIIDLKLAVGEPYDDKRLYRATHFDKDSMAEDTIEIILSLRPLTSVNPEKFEWRQEDMIVAGQIDLAHVTFSGWYKDDKGRVKQVPVNMIASELAAINHHLESRA